MTIHKSKYSTIFKTFNSDIDNISSKWGLFGKSFYDVSTDIEKRWNNVSKTLQSTNDYTLQNITNAWKMGNSNPIKFLADDEVVSILDRYNKALDSGAEATAKFLNNGTGNEFMDGFLKDLDGAPATMDKYKVATKNATMAQKSFSASTIATKAAVLALNVAVSMGLSIALSALIKTISEVTQSEENLKDTSRELGSELSSNASAIEDYKEKINDLKNVLSDSSSSFDDVSQARADLMVIQDELIKKFGTEKGVIEDITEAIYGQTDALDELSRDAYYKAKNEFNEKTNGDKFKDWLSFGSTDDDRIQSNMDKMVSQMRSSVYELETTGNEVLDNLIAKSYGLNIYDDMYGDGQHFLITGELDEIQEKLYGIQELSQDFDVSTGFENNFTEISNDVDSLLESYQDLYDQYVLYEKILTNNPDNEYDEQFNLINQAKEAYDEAVKSGDADAMQKASENYAQTLSSAIDLAMNNYDYDVVDYFGDMYPDMQQMFSEWKFTLDFEPNTDGLKDKVSNSLIGLEGFSSEDIMAFNPNVATEEQITAYGELNNIASEYGLTLQGLINLLMQMGLIQSESYQQMVAQFGQDNVNKIAPEDLVFAYQIQNVGDMTFEEFQAEIQRLKDEASNPNEITVLSFAESISQIETLSEGLDQLGKIYNDIKDAGDFDYSSVLNNDDFKNAFSEYQEEYENFIKTITNSPNDIEACQEAFDRLASAYVDNCEELKNVTAESANAVTQLLKQKGIANAQELVEARLNAERIKAKLSLDDMTDATYDNINALLKEENASDLTKQALFELISATKIFKNETLSSNGKLKELEKLAVAFGIVSDAANQASYSMQIENTISNLKKSGGFSDSYLNSLREQMSERMYSVAEKEYKAKFGTLVNIYTPTSSSSSSKTSSSSSKSSESEKEFDHIATKLEKLSDELSDLDGKVANTYSTWTERNKKLTESITKTKEAISLQNQAYQAYMREANAVGLSDTYKRLVQNGAMNISVIKDDKLADKISKYEDYYNKAQDSLKSVSELQNTLNELSSTEKWELFKGESDADISELDAYLDKAQNLIDKAELQGKFSNSSVYTDMLNLTTNKITDLRNQADQLNTILDTMTQGTEAYDELFNELLSIRNQISDLENECIEFNNNIRNLNWEVFEYLEDSISRITDEMHYLIDLVANEDLFDDKGSYTKYADATIALHAANYDVYKQMAQDYYEEVQSLQKELLNGGGKDVLEQYNEMLDKHRDMIKSANDEKQAILDLVENGMSARLDALNEIIDKYNELEDKQQSARDYQKDIENQVKSISALEKQLMAYQNDDSEEAKSKIQQITVDLEDARQQLEETEMDKNIQDRRELLESLSLEFQEWQNARIDNSDELLNQIIGNLQTEGDEINATLKEVADANGTLISGSITSIFDANSPFTSGLTSISDGVAGTTNAINNLIAQVSGIAGILTSTNAGTNDTNKGSSNSSKPVTNNTVKPQPSTTTTVSNTNKQQTTPKVESKPSGSDIFIHKKDSFDKKKLSKDTSIVD